MKVGRYLQVNYAGWNSKFRLKHELYLSTDPDSCNIHVSERVTTETLITFSSAAGQPTKMTPMVRELFGIGGIAQIILYPYRVYLRKASVFSWEELLPRIDEVVLKHLTA